jgi:ATP-dependent helicase/nuclease subunit B
VLEQWMKEDDCDPAKLRPRAEALLAGAAAHPLMRALWQPRLMEAIDFIAGRSRRTGHRAGIPWRPKSAGVASSQGSAQGSRRPDRSLRGRQPRHRRLQDRPAAERQSGRGGLFAPARTAWLIAEHGGFDGVEGAAACFEYWSLARKAGRLGFVTSPVGGRTGLDAADFTTLAARNFIAVAERWLTGTSRSPPGFIPNMRPMATMTS